MKMMVVRRRRNSEESKLKKELGDTGQRQPARNPSRQALIPLTTGND